MSSKFRNSVHKHFGPPSKVRPDESAVYRRQLCPQLDAHLESLRDAVQSNLLKYPEQMIYLSTGVG